MDEENGETETNSEYEKNKCIHINKNELCISIYWNDWERAK